jgi:prepilin-type N-terminal cleavage/methylation domain-containing protein
MHRLRGTRRGITLVELLVVITIVAALFALVAAVAPRMGERQRASRGAGMVQSWLNLAKQRALRDQRPRGIRLPWVPANNGIAYVTELQFIELPEVFTGGHLWMPYDNSPGLLSNRYLNVRIAGVEIPLYRSNPPNPQDEFSDFNAVKPGDLLDAYGTPPEQQVRRILHIQKDPDGSFPEQPSYKVTLDQEIGGYRAPYPNPPPLPTTLYRIFRQARPMPGEPTLQLPKDIGIDISRDVTNTQPNWYRLYPPTANSGGASPFDILFSPSGRVIGFESTLGSRICLWVRDVSINDPQPMFPTGSNATDPTKLPPGDNTLITIYTRSGQIAAHPVDDTKDPTTGKYIRLLPNVPPSQMSNWNPFFFTQDGQSSGN